MKPSLTLIAPSYNHEEYIEECLESIFNQCSLNYYLDLIVIDDASSDGTVDLIELFLKKNRLNSSIRNIRFIKNELNRGAHHNYNLGIKLSQSDVIHFMNTDDYIQPQRFSSVMNEFGNIDNENEANCQKYFWGFGKVKLIDEKSCEIPGDGFWQYLQNIIQYSIKRLPTVSFSMTKDNLSISTGNIYVSRYLAQLLNGFNRYKYVHDWDFCLRCLLFSEPILIDAIDSEYMYRHHEKNTFKKLDHIGGLESFEVLYRYFFNTLLRAPINTKTLSLRNHGAALFSAFLVENQDQREIVRQILGGDIKKMIHFST